MKKNVTILLFDEVEVLDFAGPFEVFSVADKCREGSLFEVRTVARTKAPVRAVGGLTVVPDHAFADCPPPDILVVPGGIGTRSLLHDDALIAWLRSTSEAASLVASVCTGALLLGQAGLLNGLRVTTHHLALDFLRAVAPGATVDPSRRFHDNGKFCTAAGISAGIDLSLHLVGRLGGAGLKEETARRMEYELRS